MAPPFGFRRSSGTERSRADATTTAANASFTSITSRSLTARPARARAVVMARDGWVNKDVPGPATSP